MAERSLRLLSLDGGGVRGLATLYLLRVLLAHFGDEKPCDFFDMIAGTSTGGLIAIMLGCLEMTVDECIEAYVKLMGTIFKREHRLPFDLLNGKVKARYSTRELENAIKSIIRSRNLPEDVLMRHTPAPRCKTFVVAISGNARELTHFTNYAKTAESSRFYDDVKLWEAARATSAATSFFDPITIDGSMFWDGGLGANNPVDRLWKEAREMFGPASLEPQLRCVLSVGTGRPALKAFGTNLKEVGTTLISIATETEKTASDFYENHEDLANRDGYFRFNPPDLDEVGMDETGARALIRDRTDVYQKHYMQRIAIRRFQEVAGSEQNPVAPAQNPVADSIPTRLFYSLDQGPAHLKPGRVASYWHHLTYASYQLYERIAHDCKKRSAHPNGKVYFSAFLQMFNLTQPSPAKVAEAWSRLLRVKADIHTSRQPVAFVMAVLYMLHVEKYLDKTPTDLYDLEGDRRKALKRFDHWVPCECNRGCQKEWCFVNDVGLSRGSQKTCGVERYLEGKPLRNALLASKDRKILERMREKWAIPRKPEY